jgi:hypothetical protein
LTSFFYNRESDDVRKRVVHDVQHEFVYLGCMTMNKLMSLVVTLIYATVLTMVVGFVVSSIKGYSYDFASAIPYGIAIGLILYLFSFLIVSEEKKA